MHEHGTRVYWTWHRVDADPFLECTKSCIEKEQQLQPWLLMWTGVACETTILGALPPYFMPLTRHRALHEEKPSAGRPDDNNIMPF